MLIFMIQKEETDIVLNFMIPLLTYTLEIIHLNYNNISVSRHFITDDIL
jgi:hypothetical protein